MQSSNCFFCFFLEELKKMSSQNIIQEIKRYEKEHNVKVLKAQIRDGHFVPAESETAACLAQEEPEVFVDVWNCRAAIAVLEHDGSVERIADIGDLPRRDQRVVNRIIYDENDGAINLSGHYYPQTPSSLAALQRLREKLKGQES